MKDQLQDLVKHTFSLGCIELVKIKGSPTECLIESLSEDKSLVLMGKFKSPMQEFDGVFGMPNLGKLNVLLNIPEYQDGAKISLLTKKEESGETVPAGLRFQNQSGDFKNDYRFMNRASVSERLKNVTFKGANWDITFEPTVANITRLKYQSQAHSEENFFTAKTDGTDLKFYFGDHSTHAGDFVFHSGVTGKLNKPWKWPVGMVLSILGLSGDKTMQFSEDGVAKITVDSGVAVYEYLLPANTK
jgi:hypothetical protein